MKKSAFTTSDLARICHVTGETVKRWLEQGRIKGYRVGPAGHWRILPKDLVLFLRKNDIPFPEPEETGIDLKALTIIEDSPTFCWEFHKNKISNHVRPEGNCEDCLVYKVKSIHCYALREEVGHKKIYCDYSCEDCGYFHVVKKEMLTKM